MDRFSRTFVEKWRKKFLSSTTIQKMEYCSLFRVPMEKLDHFEVYPLGHTDTNDGKRSKSWKQLIFKFLPPESYVKTCSLWSQPNRERQSTKDFH